jgi:hypothetical protein
MTRSGLISAKIFFTSSVLTRFNFEMVQFSISTFLELYVPNVSYLEFAIFAILYPVSPLTPNTRSFFFIVSHLRRYSL